MRETMRRTFDELWIIDLGGDNLGTRKTPNVFNIQTPVAIAIGVRAEESKSDKSAKVHYAKIDGLSREDKLAKLEAVEGFGQLAWRACPDGWHKPFLPIGMGDFFDWPSLDDLFPWRHSGTQFKRSWPIGETAELLERRIAELYAADGTEKPNLFVETGSNNLRSRGYGKRGNERINPTRQMILTSTIPKPSRYGFRSFDTQFAILSDCLADRIRPELQAVQGGSQIFFTTLFSEPLANGGALTASAYLPDLHHFRGSFGGKDVIPLYLDVAGTKANITKGLLAVLSEHYSTLVTPQDLAGYVYATLGGQSYTRRFWNELETPGPRVPLTKVETIFVETAKLGRRLIWLHTYAERFRADQRGDEVPAGAAKIIKGISDNPVQYPESYSFDPDTGEITVGDGRIGPVTLDVWEFEVSGLKVVQSWLGYRMKARAGKKSSPLDLTRPERWTARMSEELLELLWVLEATLSMEPDLEAQLDKIVAGPCFTAAELPEPTEDERKAPGAGASSAGALLGLMGVESDDGADDEDDSDE